MKLEVAVSVTEKRTMARRIGKAGWGDVVNFGKVVRDGVSGEMTLEQRLKGGEGGSHADFGRRTFRAARTAGAKALRRAFHYEAGPRTKPMLPALLRKAPHYPDRK